MAVQIFDENGISNFVDRNGQSGFVDQDGDFFASEGASEGGAVPTRLPRGQVWHPDGWHFVR